MRVLVTGGGGFLGRYIVEQLAARGDHVRILARGRYPELVSQNIEVFSADLRDASAVSQAADGMEAVIHTAALPGIWGPWKEFYEINTVGTRNVLSACKTHHISRLVYTSSPSVIFDGREHRLADESLPYPKKFLAHYPHSKAIAEQEVLAANNSQSLCTVALRPHLIWGPRDNHLIPRLIQRARSGRLVQVGDGTNQISMSYVENTAKAHLQALDHLYAGAACCGEAYFINEPEPVRMWEWINELLAIASLPPVKRKVSTSTANIMGRLIEGVYRVGRISAEPPLTRFLAAQLAQSHSYSIGKAQRDFGYAPDISYEEGMRRLAPEIRKLAAKSP